MSNLGSDPAAEVAWPMMVGRRNFGAFGNEVCSTWVTVKPALVMESSVGRLHSQPTMKRLNPFMRLKFGPALRRRSERVQ